MPGCTALLLILISSSRKQTLQRVFTTKIQPQFPFSNRSRTTPEFSSLYLWVPLLPPFKLHLHKKQTNPHYSGKLSSMCFQMCKLNIWEPNLLEERQNQNTAIPYKSPSIRTRQKHHTGFCNPVSVPFIACRWDEFSWRLVTSLYFKITPQNHKPPNTAKNNMKNTNMLPQTQCRFWRASVLHSHSIAVN